jgi:hypothetical protein
VSRRRLATLGVLLGLILVGFSATAGSCETHSDAPSPTGNNVRPGTNARVIQEPDGFRNVSFSCMGTTGVYVTSDGYGGTSATHYASGIAVLANDPACK